MAAPIINDEIDPDPETDLAHPIPYLGVLDVASYQKTGGADLVIVVASPLAADPRSETRLLNKMEGYLGYVASDQFQEDAGTRPTPENTTVTVALHPDSAPEIFALLERCHEWVGAANARLVVRRLREDELSGD